MAPQVSGVPAVNSGLRRRQLLRLLAALVPLPAFGWGKPEEVFAVRSAVRRQSVAEIRFSVEPGHALYRERILVRSLTPQVEVLAVRLPAGQLIFDETLGRHQVHLKGEFSATVDLRGAPGPVRFAVQVQGCADAGICYVPITFDIVAREG